MRYRITVIMVLVLLPYMVLAQQLDLEDLNVRSVSIESGLSQSSVNAIAQDNLGYIWLATGDGLNKYDGFNVQVFKFSRTDSFTIPHNNVNDVLALKDGRIAASTESGVGIYNHSTNNITRVQRLTENSETTFEVVFGLYQYDDEHLWMGTDIGIVSKNLKDGTVRLIAPRTSELSGVVTDFGRMGDTLFAASSAGLMKVVETSEGYGLEEINRLSGVYFTTMVATENELWLGSWGNGLIRVTESDNSESDSQYEIKVLDTIESTSINSIYIDTPGRIWIAGNRGLALSYDGVTFEKYNPSQRLSESIPDARTLSVFVDHSENLWVGTFINGAVIADLKPAKFFNLGSQHHSEASLYAPIWTLSEYPDGIIWVGTDHGIYTVDLQNDFEVQIGEGLSYLPEEISGGYITYIYKDPHEGVWIGTANNGVFYYSENQNQIKHFPFDESDQSLCGYEVMVIRATDKDIWVGTSGGLNNIDRESFEVSCFSDKPEVEDILSGRITYSLHVSEFEKEYLYVGLDNGLQRIHTSDYLVETIPLIFYEEIEIDDEIFSIYKANSDYVYLGTQNGLLRYEYNSGKTHYFEEQLAVKNNFVYTIQPGTEKDIWLSTNRGLVRVSNIHAENPDELLFRVFDTNDGLLSNEFNQGAAYKSSTGEMFYGNLAGVNYFEPNNLANNPHPPKLNINGLAVVRGAEQKYYPLSDVEELKLTLSKTDNLLNFYYSVLDYTQPAKNLVEYKLEGSGLGVTRKFLSEGTSAEFNNLKPGTYTFTLRGSNNDGIWSETTVSIQLIITPPFHQTNWFYFILALIAIGILYTGGKYRERTLNIRNEELEKLVQIRTQELQQRELLFRMISENATELISMVDVNGTILYASPSYEEDLGHSYDNLFGDNIYELLHPDDREIAKIAFQDIKESNRTQSMELRFRSIRDRYKIYRVNAAAISSADAKGSSARFVVVSHNIDSQKQTELALKQAKDQAEQANMAKSAFLAGMSHELRTPLNAILGFAQILKRSKEIPERERNYVETMYSSGNHLLSMINDVLDISKIEAGRMNILKEEFDLKLLLRDIEDMFRLQAQEKNLKFDVVINMDVPDFIYADAGKMRQVLINIVSNGIKYTSDGFVTLSVIYEPTIMQDEEDKITFEVSDSGEGIPDSQLTNIFEPFQQLSENYSKGTGLGLAISSRLVSMMKGKLAVDSKLGHGSVFYFSIPVTNVTRPPHYSDGPQIIYTGIEDDKIWKVLIVDDIEYNLTLLESLLEPLGFICIRAEDGQQALNILEVQEPDFILMDLRMPNLGGTEAMKKIRETKKFSDIPILAITASGFKGKKEKLLKEGFDAYIRKPYKEEELINEISRVTGIVFKKRESDPKSEPAKNESISRFVKVINSLQEPHKNTVKEAIEITDLETVASLTEEFMNDPDFAIIYKKAKNREYSFFIKINETLNPVNG